MNYYERHIGDYLKDTAHLSLLEHGVYSRLLDVYYTRECSIPADQVARLVGARTKEELAALNAVLSEFFVQEDQGGWVQLRCESEIARYRDKRAKAKASANSRWGNKSEHCERNANASSEHMRSQSQGNAPRARPQTPVTSNQPPVSEPKVPHSSGRRGSRLPQDWSLTPELEAYCREERPDLDPIKTADRFRDYWVAKAGKEGVKLDWSATWRNWVRNEKAQTQPRNEQQSFAARNAEARRILGFAPKPLDGAIDG